MNFTRLFNAHDAWFVRRLSRKAIVGTAVDKPVATRPDQDVQKSQQNLQNTRDSQNQPSQTHQAQQPAIENPSGNTGQAVDSKTDAAQDNPADEKGEPEVKPAEQANKELFRVRASRLVDFFPNELIVNEKNITVIKRDLFVSRTETWSIEDLGEVTLINAPIFVGLRLVGKIAAHKLNLKGIPKDKAIKAKELIDGLVLENQQQVNLPQRTSTAEYRKQLAKAGELPEGTEPMP